MSFRSNIRTALAWEGDPWAKSFAYAAFSELFDSQSFVPIFSSVVGNAGCCWMAPVVEQHSVVLHAYYAPKRRLIDPSILIRPDLEDLTANWENFCRGYVIARFDEGSHVPFSCVGHAATTRAARELNITARLGLPRFDEFTRSGSRYLERHRDDHGISHTDGNVDVPAMHRHELYMRS